MVCSEEFACKWPTGFNERDFSIYIYPSGVALIDRGHEHFLAYVWLQTLNTLWVIAWELVVIL